MSLFLKYTFCIFFFCANAFSACAQQIVLNAVGDIMLAGSGTGTLARKGYDYPFAATLHELKAADINVGNLEAPITENGSEFTDKKFRFKTSPKASAALKRAGFSVLTLANNHMMDFGTIGLQETLRQLDAENILYTGAGGNLASARKPALLSLKNNKVAFLAYSLTLPAEFYAKSHQAGTAPGFAPFYREDIMKAKSNADFVVVSFHWGEERSTKPKAYQVQAAHQAIDAGADVVIGHHPHVLQGIERYKNGIILYSLGNFAFGSLSSSSDTSIIARIIFDRGIREVELIPLNVLNAQVRFQPKIAPGRQGMGVIRHISLLSAQLGTEIGTDGKRYLVKMVHNE
jgi:poly-gamma-glutamate capsule biosynthesis protein CapA/YwtB (metallophosphatase superfamily)